MALEDPGFWQGVGAAGATGALGFIGRIIARRHTRRETIEERLERWQEKMVLEIRAENSGLRTRVAELETKASHMVVLEACLRMVVIEVRRLDPASKVLDQVGAMLARAIPVDAEMPEDMVALMSAADQALRTSRKRK